MTFSIALVWLLVAVTSIEARPKPTGHGDFQYVRQQLFNQPGATKRDWMNTVNQDRLSYHSNDLHQGNADFQRSDNYQRNVPYSRNTYRQRGDFYQHNDPYLRKLLQSGDLYQRNDQYPRNTEIQRTTQQHLHSNNPFLNAPKTFDIVENKSPTEDAEEKVTLDVQKPVGKKDQVEKRDQMKSGILIDDNIKNMPTALNEITRDDEVLSDTNINEEKLSFKKNDFTIDTMDPVLPKTKVTAKDIEEIFQKLSVLLKKSSDMFQEFNKVKNRSDKISEDKPEVEKEDTKPLAAKDIESDAEITSVDVSNKLDANPIDVSDKQDTKPESKYEYLFKDEAEEDIAPKADPESAEINQVDITEVRFAKTTENDEIILKKHAENGGPRSENKTEKDAIVVDNREDKRSEKSEIPANAKKHQQKKELETSDNAVDELDREGTIKKSIIANKRPKKDDYKINQQQNGDQISSYQKDVYDNMRNDPIPRNIIYPRYPEKNDPYQGSVHQRSYYQRDPYDQNPYQYYLYQRRPYQRNFFLYDQLKDQAGPPLGK